MSLGHNIYGNTNNDFNDDSGDEVSDNTIGLQACLLFIFILTLAILEAIKKPDFWLSSIQTIKNIVKSSSKCLEKIPLMDHGLTITVVISCSTKTAVFQALGESRQLHKLKRWRVK